MENTTIKISESMLRNIVSECTKDVLKEYGGVSLTDYDNPNVRRSRLDGDEMTALNQYDANRDEVEGHFPPDDGDREEVLNTILRLRNNGLISDIECDKMRDVVGV